MATIDSEFDWERSETPTFDPVVLMGADVVREFGLPKLADWRVCYSEDGRPLKAAAANGEWREYRYDAEARLVEIKNQGGRQFTFLRNGPCDTHPWVVVHHGTDAIAKTHPFDAYGLRHSAEGMRTTTVYDADGRRVESERSA